MKIKRILGVLLSTILVTSSMVVPTMAANYDDTNTKFEYSLKPGMEEWGQLNHGERVLASQIPNDVLKNMTTNELLTAVLDYPCFVDMIFYDTYQDGYEVVRDNFNGLQELLGREDSGEYLLDTYKNIELAQILTISDEDTKFNESLQMLYLETILAQPEVTETLSTESLEEVEKIVKENYEMQLANKDDTLSLSYSGYYESLADQQDIELYDYGTTVSTPNGSSVNVIVRTGTDYAYNNRTAIKNSIEHNYPGASVVGNATIKYNCHAYAWAHRTNVWMNNPSKYWTDGSYSLEASNSPTDVGQKVYYPGSGKEHSGNVISLSGNTIRSKWGEQSLVEHSVGNCPYFFIPLSVKFYGR